MLQSQCAVGRGLERIFITFLLLLLTGEITALGINCRGSGLCPRASWNNKLQVSVIQGLRDFVWASPKPNSTTYKSGDHIICVSQNQPITISPSFTGPSIDGVSAGASVGLSGTISEGGICLFPQHTSLTLEQIRPLTDAILDHKCTTCGSVPIHFVDEGSNDPGAGILTFNYVAAPTCDRNCISDISSPAPPPSSPPPDSNPPSGSGQSPSTPPPDSNPPPDSDQSSSSSSSSEQSSPTAEGNSPSSGAQQTQSSSSPSQPTDQNNSGGSASSSPDNNNDDSGSDSQSTTAGGGAAAATSDSNPIISTVTQQVSTVTAAASNPSSPNSAVSIVTVPAGSAASTSTATAAQGGGGSSSSTSSPSPATPKSGAAHCVEAAAGLKVLVIGMVCGAVLPFFFF